MRTGRRLFPELGKVAWVLLVWLAMTAAVSSSQAARSHPVTRGDVFRTYRDPGGRYSFDYPRTMQVDKPTPNAVRVFHPKATLRIWVFLESRKGTRSTAVKPLIEAFKERLDRQMSDVRILEEGSLFPKQASEGFVICNFTDRRGITLTQLVQYFLTSRTIIQLVISDRPQGFKNLEPVIRRIHRSVRVAPDGPVPAHDVDRKPAIR
jgi:hypothetical protein